MKFFKSLLANHSFSTTDFSTESNHNDTIDHAAQASQTAMSSALASYVQATAAIGSSTFDAKPVGVSEPVHAIAPTAPQTLDFHSFAHDVLALVAPAVHVAPVESATPVVTHAIEVHKAATLDAVPARVVEWAHAAQADTAQIDTFESVERVIHTHNAVPLTMEFHDKGDLLAPLKSDLEPAPESARIAEIAHDPVLKIDSDVFPGSTDSTIPKPADGADRWENHSMFSVKSPESEESSGNTWEKGIVNPVYAAHHWTDTFWEDGTPVAESVVPGTIGTAISGDADPSNAEPVAGCTPSLPEDWMPNDDIVLEVPAYGWVFKIPVLDVAEPTTAIAAPEPTSLPEVADGADRWENHSMFSVAGPSEGTVVAKDTGVAKTAKIDTTEAITTVEGKDARPAQDLGSDSTEPWFCHQPGSTEAMRNHPIAEFTLPLRSSGSGTTQVVDATSYDVVVAVTPSFIGTEQHAVF